MAACSSSGSDLPPPQFDSTTMKPLEAFSGNDGAYEYTMNIVAPRVTNGRAPTTWTIDDPSVASVTYSDVESWHALVRTKKAGKTIIRASVAGHTYTMPLTVTQYTPKARDLGEELYQEDKGQLASDGSKPLGCIHCHGAVGGPAHSPSQIGGYDDAMILKIIATGVKPDGTLANGGAHKFTLTGDQPQAILARLRSLPPIDYPK
jgi:hypothetical protein